MDWERKFSSIVRETESNLAKVKQRLGSAHASSVTALSLNGSADMIPERGPRQLGTSFAASFPPPFLGLSTNLTTSTPTKAVSYGLTNLWPGETGHVSFDQSPGIVSLLSDKLDAQTKAMEQVALTVRRLEEERDRYQRQVRDLKDEMTMLGSRMAERGVDLGTEQKMESWKRDVMAEIQLMQSQIQLHRSDDMYGMGSSGSQATAILQELHDTKKHVTDECEMVRREVDSVKSRLMKLEIDVTNVIADNRDIGRRHDRLDRENNNLRNYSGSMGVRRAQSMRDLVDSHNLTAHDVSRTLGERTRDKADIVELKSSLRNIQEKLDKVQDRVQEDLLKPKRPPKKPVRKTRPRRIVNDVMSPTTSDLDDISDSTDLADLQSSDFSFSPKAKPTPNVMRTLSEDDLDLDDLNLTTDDLISTYSCLDPI